MCVWFDLGPPQMFQQSRRDSGWTGHVGSIEVCSQHGRTRGREVSAILLDVHVPVEYSLLLIAFMSCYNTILTLNWWKVDAGK